MLRTDALIRNVPTGGTGVSTTSPGPKAMKRLESLFGKENAGKENEFIFFSPIFLFH